MGVLLLLHAALSIAYLWSRASAEVDRRLHIDFDVASLSLRRAEGEFIWVEPPRRELAAYDDLPAIDVWTPEGHEVFYIAGLGVRRLPPWQPGSTGLTTLSLRNDLKVRALAAPLRVDGADAILRVARPAHSVSDEFRSFGQALTFATLGSFALLTFGAWQFARVTMAPLGSFVARARTVSAGNLHERLPVPATGDEWQELAVTFNAAIVRLEAAFVRLETFSSNVAHELRTPLTAMRAAAEVALRSPGVD
ncbi:MAG TPA: HAMP domain-containing protein, partial [Burkholderiaceae bacterium]|nr:HAMP domain-containing protein [Burkholderiaceae bacterium]